MTGMETERIQIVEAIIGRLMRTYDACDNGRHSMLTLAEKARWDDSTDDLVEKSQRLSRFCEGFLRELQGLYELKKLMSEGKDEIKIIEIERVDSSWNRPNKAEEE